MTPSSLRTLLVAALVSTLALSACGGDDVSIKGATSYDPHAVMVTSHNSSKAAKSVCITHNSTSPEGENVRFTSSGRTDGTNEETTLSAPSIGTVTVRTVGTSRYIKGDRAYWSKAGMGTSTRNDNRFVRLSPGQATPVGKLTVKEMMSGLTGSQDEVAFPKGVVPTRTTVGQTPALQMPPADESKAPPAKSGEEFATVFVAESAGHELLQIRTKSSTVTFSDWNVVPPYTAPPYTPPVG